MRRALCLATAGLALAPAAARADVGAPGVGDPYFPREGNGGYDAQHYDLTLSYSPRANRLAGRTVIQARALVPLTRFDLDLKGMKVRRVTVDGRPAAFHRTGQELQITPAAPLAAGAPFTVSVRYRGVPRTVTGSNIIAGEPYGFVHTPDGEFIAAEPDAASTWFPCNDHPSDKATFAFRVTVPRDRRVLANGRLVSRSTHGKRATFVWAENAPMATYLATVDSGRWKIRRGRTAGGIRTIVAVDPRLAHHRTVGYFFNASARAVDYEATVFGPYPFGSTGAIVDNARYRGFPLGFSLETQTRPVYSQFQDPLTIAHELAHQWFGDSVSVSRWSDIWLNEGFASFAEYLYVEHRGGQSAPRSFRDDYRTPAKSAFWKLKIGDPKRRAMFDIAVYRRGAMTLQALREKIGDGPFFALLQTWTATHRHGNATTPDFIALAERISGRDLGPFFQTWLFTPRKPRSW